MGKTPSFGELGIKPDPSESSWSKAAHFPCWRLSPRAERRGSRWAGLVPGPPGCSETRDRYHLHTHTPGKAEPKHPLRTKQQSSWHLYLPPEHTRGTAAALDAYSACICEAPCVVTAHFIPPSENISEAVATLTPAPAKQVAPLAPRGIGKLSNKPQKHRKCVRKTPTGGLTSPLPPRCPVR